MQHGEQIPTNNGGTRAKELGHFIAITQQEYMQKYLQKFDEQYKGKKYIEIQFCNDNPLTIRFERNNQGGKVCYCIEGSNKASQKTKKGWQTVTCGPDCQHRQKNEQGKYACNRIAWLKFFIPSVCRDRIWLMRITGQTSINRLDSYINLQKEQGNSLKGRYILFLKQEEQTSKTTGQSFNNYILDIVEKEEFKSQEPISQAQKNQNEIPTTNTQNVDNKVEKQESNKSNSEQHTMTKNVIKEENDKPKEKEEKKEELKEVKTTPKRATKDRTKKSAEKQKIKQEEKTETSSKTESNNYDDCYVLLKTFTETLKDKSNNSKEYLIGEFTDMNNKISNIVIRPEDEELSKCDLGTVVRLDIEEIGGRKFAMKLEFIEKKVNTIAA